MFALGNSSRDRGIEIAFGSQGATISKLKPQARCTVMPEALKIAIVEDNETYRQALVELLGEDGQYDIILTSASMEHYLWEGRNLRPDVVLMDVELPGMSGIRGIQMVKGLSPDTEVIILTVYEDWDKVFKALKEGACGYLVKSMPLAQLKTYLAILENGGAPMTPEIAMKVVQYFHPTPRKEKKSPLSRREKEVVVAIFDGCTYKEIAERLCISLGTVYSHIKNIYRKLHVHSKVELINKNLNGELAL